jgi:hypothetical protein
MNLKELARQTIPPLPDPGENQKNFNRKVVDALSDLYKRDQDKEVRIRKLEELLRRGTGKNSLERVFGSGADKWRMIFDTLSLILSVQYSNDSGITWTTVISFASSGNVTIDNLSGAGPRNAIADLTGTLSAP